MNGSEEAGMDLVARRLPSSAIVLDQQEVPPEAFICLVPS